MVVQSDREKVAARLEVHPFLYFVRHKGLEDMQIKRLNKRLKIGKIEFKASLRD